MRKMFAWVAVAAAFTLCGPAHADDGALAWAYRYVLVTSTVDTELAPVVLGIAHDSSLRDTATCDLLAEVLLRLKARKIFPKESGPLILLVLSGAPAPGRYRSVFAGMANYLSQPEAKAYMTAYRREHERAKDAPYVPGTIDLEALRRDYVAAAHAAKPTMAQAAALAALPESATMDEMFARVGKPTHVVSHDPRIAAHILDVELRQLWFYYRGVGRVIYDYKNAGARWHLAGVVADPLAFEGFMPYRGEFADAP